MAYKNKEDRKTYFAAHYQENKDYYLTRNRRYVSEKQQHIRQFKNVPCTDCRGEYPYYVMDLDHRPGTVKRYEPAQLPTLAGWDALKAELAKCDVVCSNCHRVRTYRRLNFATAQAIEPASESD